MKLKDSRAAIVFLAAVIIASGCGDGGNEGVTIGQTSGVSIQSFDATPTQLYEGQILNIEMVVKNGGAEDADRVTAKLYGPPFSGDRSWSFQSGSDRINFGTLRSADPESDQPANEVPRSWTLRAPDLDEGVSIPYDFNVRLFYLYETQGTTTISIMSDQQAREESVERSQPGLDNSGAPVQMEVRTQTPIVFYSGETATQRDLCVIVRNEGTGTPFREDAGSEGSYNINRDNRNKVDVLVEGSGNNIQFTDSTWKEVNLVNGRGVACFTMAADFVSNQQIQEDVPVTVTARYGYYVDDETTVTVDGRRGETTRDGGSGTNSDNPFNQPTR